VSGYQLNEEYGHFCLDENPKFKDQKELKERYLNFKGEFQIHKQVYADLGKYSNPNYQSFIGRNDYKDNWGDWFQAILTLAGINDKNQYIIIFNKKENRAISFLSPIDQYLTRSCVSQDGLTVLALSKNKAVIIDNPLV